MCFFFKFQKVRLKKGLYRLCVYKGSFLLENLGQYNVHTGQVFVNMGRLAFYITRGLDVRKVLKRAEFRPIIYGCFGGQVFFHACWSNAFDQIIPIKRRIKRIQRLLLTPRV